MTKRSFVEYKAGELWDLLIKSSYLRSFLYVEKMSLKHYRTLHTKDGTEIVNLNI